ncbi:asparagine synthase (glutamine-hydrolyzing) [Nostocales cyanobacterium HT-58-2]|nr:asparagine synthase (glutamine-hydrolyzing) [Nostocales cyanobacterium HT-58-2]
MSGIMGIYCLNGRFVDSADLKWMADILMHRGPDGADTWVYDSIGFGHRMLWTTPESLLEKLPLVNQTGDLVITSDARIDNRDELISQLQFDNCPPEKITDSELILAAYEKWGEQCSQHLLGDFAFAIWDKRKQSLFCARDHFGIKPFYYYYQADNIFVFASEIKGLLCLQQVPRQLNEVRIADYLALMMEDKVITIYQDILRLPPAHSMVVSQSGVRSWSYWSLDLHHEIQLDSDEAYAEEFRKIFTEAVNCRLRSAFPIVSHLSGGLDSSAVTCVARDLLTQDGTELHTISSIFDKITECDERPYINVVLKQGGFIPHYVHGDESGPLSNLDEIFQYEDEALIGPSHFYPWQLNRAVKELGLRISLDGFDGDTTVSHGIMRLTELARQGDWEFFILETKAVAQNFDIPPHTLFRGHGLPYLKDLAKRWRWIAFFKAVQQIHKHFGGSRKRLILQHGLKPLIQAVGQWWQRRQHKQDKSVNSVAPQIPLVNRIFAERIALDERIQKLGGSPKQPQSVREEQWLTLNQGLFTYTLELMDQYAAIFSLETRHPFMDKRLIEFCLALPSEQKLYGGWGRIVMRRALEGILPEEVQWRGGKADLSPNFNDGLLNRDRQLLEEVVRNKLGRLENYINLDFFQEAYQRLLLESHTISDQDCMVVWQAIILASWFDYNQLMP